MDLNDEDLEKLSVYARHLLPLLREQRDEEDIDLRQILMTHHRLYETRQQALELLRQDGAIAGHTGDGRGSRADPDTRLLSEVVQRLNELFAGGGLTDGDKLNWLNSLATKVSENAVVMDPIRSNTSQQAMLGDFPQAVQNAVIESMGAHNDLATRFLSDERVSRGVAQLLMEALRRGMQPGGTRL